MAEMGRKLALQAMEEKMQQADVLIASGATREEAAKAIDVSERSFYRYYAKWQEQKYRELSQKFKQRIHLYLVRQDYLCSKAIESGKIGVAAQINKDTLYALIDLKVIPTANKTLIENMSGYKEFEEWWAKQNSTSEPKEQL